MIGPRQRCWWWWRCLMMINQCAIWCYTLWRWWWWLWCWCLMMIIKCAIWCYTLWQARGTGVADHYQCQASLFCLHTSASSSSTLMFSITIKNGIAKGRIDMLINNKQTMQLKFPENVTIYIRSVALWKYIQVWHRLNCTLHCANK